MAFKSATYTGFKPKWKQDPDFAPPAKRSRPDFTPKRRGSYGIPSTGPKMAPRGPKTITLSKTEYQWTDPVQPGWRAAKAAMYAARIAKFAGKANPYVSALSYAWDAYSWSQELADPEWGQTRKGGIDLSNWTQCCDAGIQPLEMYSIIRSRPSAGQWSGVEAMPCSYGPLNCGLGGQVPAGYISDMPVTLTPFASRTLFTLYLGPARSGGTRFQISQQYNMAWNGSAPFPFPMLSPLVQPLPWPNMRPFPDWRMESDTDPYRDPGLDPRVRARIPAYIEPALEVATNPYGNAGRRNPGRIAPHYQMPPLPGEKEDKRIIMKQLAGQTGVGPVFGAMTEALDVVDALYKSIPGAQPGPNYNEKLAFIAAHLDEIVWTDALWNFLRNELEDRVYAKLNRLVNKPFVKNGPAAKYWPFATGVGGRWTRPPAAPKIAVRVIGK